MVDRTIDIAMNWNFERQLVINIQQRQVDGTWVPFCHATFHEGEDHLIFEDGVQYLLITTLEENGGYNVLRTTCPAGVDDARVPQALDVINNVIGLIYVDYTGPILVGGKHGKHIKYYNKTINLLRQIKKNVGRRQ